MGAKQAGEQNETLVSALERNGTKAFQPTADEQSRSEGQRSFVALVSRWVDATSPSSSFTALFLNLSKDRYFCSDVFGEHPDQAGSCSRMVPYSLDGYSYVAAPTV